MLNLNPRRILRRPILIVLLLGLALFSGYLRGLSVTFFLEFWEIRIFTDTFLESRSSTWSPAPTARLKTQNVVKTTTKSAPDVRAPDPTTAVTYAEPDHQHLLRDDGLLEVNPNAPHPIYQLIAQAESKWQGKLQRASHSLDDAVREYQRRYKRKPPLGFDEWWTYVEKNLVQLPDEYDQIFNDLEPFWGMNPKDLQDIQHEWESHEDTYTIGKVNDGSIEIVNSSLSGSEETKRNLLTGGLEILELLEEVQYYIPAFRAVFSPHDNPNLHTDWELKQMALNASAEGRFIDINNPPEVKLHGWISACPPNSKAWASSIKFSSPPPTRPSYPKTFIHDHRVAMDPCTHPNLLLQHGQFVSHKAGPVPHRKLIPQFSYCPTMLHQDITPAVPINWIEDIYPRVNDPEWHQKVEDRLLWRGRNTGIWHGEDETVRWVDSQRDRLVEWANDLEGNLTVLDNRGRRKKDKDAEKKKSGFLVVPEERQHHQHGIWGNWEYEPVGNGTSVKKARYAPALLDIAFASEPVSCEPKICEELKKRFEFRKMQDIKSAGRYKYILDVDGNGWSSRFKRLITSNALIFKSSIYPEWWLDRVQPWVHYIPVQNDYSDLVDLVLFFRGDLESWNGREEEELGRKIAREGREWSLRFWRKEDMVAYMFRLFLEYARVMNPDREFMYYDHRDSTLAWDEK